MPYTNPYLNQFGAYQQPQYTPPMPQPQVTQQGIGQSMQQPVHGFIYVTGLDGAKAYQMPPNSEVPLFDSTDDVLYIKTTDGAGFPTISVCDVFKRGNADGDQGEYVTRDELDRAYRDLAGQLDRMRGEINGLVPTAAETADAKQDAASKAGTGRRSARRGKAGADDQ